MAACCSINMRIFKTAELILLLFFVVSSCSASPIDAPAPTDPSELSEPNIHYDQRQNGSENFRIHVDGLVVVVAPVESLLLAGGIPGVSDANIFGSQQGGINEKPSKPQEPVEPKPESETSKPEAIKDKHLTAKSSHRPSLRLMSLLSPFLRKIQPHH